MKDRDFPTIENRDSGDRRTNTIQFYGFRSRKWYKMLLAYLYLFVMSLLFLVMVVAGDVIDDISIYDSFIDKLGGLLVVFAFIAPYLILSNIFGLRNKLPLYRRRKFISTTIAVALTVLFFGIIGWQTFTLHSAEYEKAYGVFVTMNQGRL
jgi:hypothetical protein